MKTLLIVSGGIEACHGIRHAKDMGFKVVCSDLNPEAPGFALADGHFIASTYDAEATAAGAEEYVRARGPIDGVTTIGADVPLTVATVAARLHLPGISLESARLATDKLAMKRRFAECGVAVPWFSAVASAEELLHIVETRGRELVIKPVDSRGSRGVQRLACVDDLAAAFAFARDYSPTQRVMVEAYLNGPQVSTESAAIGGRCFTPGFSDRNYEYLDTYAPFFIENGGDLPSRLPLETQDEVKRVVAAAAAALGVETGTVKGDIVVHEGKVYVIELAARLSGGFFCSREIPLNTGVDFIGAAFKLALGLKVDAAEVTPKYQRHIIQRYVIPKPGTVVSIGGAAAAMKVPGVIEAFVTAKPGDVIPPAGDKRPSAAMVLATGETRDQALQAARAAIAELAVVTA
jgi:biotin carboxylase